MEKQSKENMSLYKEHIFVECKEDEECVIVITNVSCQVFWNVGWKNL